MVANHQRPTFTDLVSRIIWPGKGFRLRIPICFTRGGHWFPITTYFHNFLPVALWVSRAQMPDIYKSSVFTILSFSGVIPQPAECWIKDEFDIYVRSQWFKPISKSTKFLHCYVLLWVKLIVWTLQSCLKKESMT